MIVALLMLTLALGLVVLVTWTLGVPLRDRSARAQGSATKESIKAASPMQASARLLAALLAMAGAAAFVIGLTVRWVARLLQQWFF